MSSLARKSAPERWIGLVVVALLHGVVLYGMWSYKLLPTPKDAATLFVNFINPPAPPKPKEEPPPPPQVQPPKEVKLDQPRPVPQPQPRQLVAEAPVTSPAEPVAPPPPPRPEPLPPIEAPPPPPAPPKPAGPVSLGGELSVACPERTPPVYPMMSKRLGEQGRVVLRVELDETGRVSGARVTNSSGVPRLDEAALAAVRQWHCNPAKRDGEPVRAVATQPFDFTLKEN